MFNTFFEAKVVFNNEKSKYFESYGMDKILTPGDAY